MTQVRVHFVNPEKMGDFYFRKDIEQLAVSMFAAGHYEGMNIGEIDAVGKDAAEEVFDISNNPSRGDERYELFGRCRSVSVGDMVETEQGLYLCAPFGWIAVDIDRAVAV